VAARQCRQPFEELDRIEDEMRRAIGPLADEGPRPFLRVEGARLPWLPLRAALASPGRATSARGETGQQMRKTEGERNGLKRDETI
jgi:hypothetical protein